MDLLFLNRVSSEFADKVISLSDLLSIDPNWLMFLMDFESGIDSTRENAFGCVGLIQFCADYPGGDSKTISGIEYKLATIKAMSPENQLDLVYAYLKSIQKDKGKFSDYYQLYFAILYPDAYGKPDDYVLNTNSNPIFDLNKDGKITISEVKSYLDSRVHQTIGSQYWDTFFKKKTFCSSIKEKSFSGQQLPC